MPTLTQPPMILKAARLTLELKNQNNLSQSPSNIKATSYSKSETIASPIVDRAREQGHEVLLLASGTAPCRHRNALRTRVRTPGLFAMTPDHAALRSSRIASRASERSHRRCARRPGKAESTAIPGQRRVARRKHARAALQHGLFGAPSANSCALLELIFSLSAGRASASAAAARTWA